MIRLENTSKSVKVLKAFGKKTLRIFPGFNNVDIDKKDLAAYSKTPVNQAMIKESIKLVGEDIILSKEDHMAAKTAMEKNEKLNKAQKVIAQQNELILKKDKANDDQSALIAQLTESNAKQAELMAKMQKQLDKLEKKDK